MAKSATGGALRGLGQALMRRSDNEREDRIRSEDRAHDEEMLMREQAFQRAAQIRNEIFGREEASTRRDFERGENQKERDFEAGLVSDVIPMEGAEDRILTRGGQTRGLGGRSRQTRSSASDRNDDKFIVDEIKERHTTTDGETGEKSTDWGAVVRDLRARGRDDLASLYAGGETDGGGPEAPELEQYDTNADMVRTERDRLRGEGKTSPELDEYVDIDQRNRQLAGRGGGTGAAKGANGKGSQENPHTPMTEEEFDAIPSGAYYRDPDDGRLYRKR